MIVFGFNMLLVACSTLWLAVVAEVGGTEKRQVLIPMETFQYENYFFTFYTQHANWDEAYTICRATHARLAVANTYAIAEFLARTMTETQISFTDIWIGGRFMRDHWAWAATGEQVPRRNNPKGYPPWVRWPTQRGKHCLALDRRSHDCPLFVELHCGIQRPFICEKNVIEAVNNYPQKSVTTTYRNVTYTTYHASVTWDEALAFCRQAGGMLATVEDWALAYFIIGIMRRARPGLESMWVGGKNMFGQWMWLSDNTGFSNTSSSNGFPPWMYNTSRPDKGKDCLLFDHHACNHHHFGRLKHRRTNCEEPVFVDSECEKRRNFMCESVKETVKIENYPTIYMGVQYVFISVKRTWLEAYLDCLARGMNLVTVTSPKNLQFLVTMMSELEEDWFHLWLGGVFNEETGRWVWNSTNTVIPNKYLYPTRKDRKRDREKMPEGDFPPWCANRQVNTETEDLCLNLDRGDHIMSVWYGLDCNTKQGYVCEMTHLEELPSKRFVPPLTLLHYDNTNFFSAKKLCQAEGGTLVTVNSITKARIIASNDLPTDREIWVGGQRKDGNWIWTETDEVIPNFANYDGYPPWGNLESYDGLQCLSMIVGPNKWPIFKEQSCDKPLSYMCELPKKTYPQATFTLRVHDIWYHFYQYQATWHEALEICEESGLHLAEVLTSGVTKLLSTAMEQNNESLWLAGRNMNNMWEWVISGDNIEKSDTREPGYPLWLNGSKLHDKKNSGPCLAFEHIVIPGESPKPHFVGRACSKKFGFACVRDTESPDEKYEKKMELNDTTYICIGKAYTREESNIICNLRGGVVPSINSVDMAKKLFATCDVISGFWIDAYEDNAGIWRISSTNASLDKDIAFMTNPYDAKCLTLNYDRKSKRTAFRASECNVPEKVICTIIPTHPPSTTSVTEYTLSTTSEKYPTDRPIATRTTTQPIKSTEQTTTAETTQVTTTYTPTTTSMTTTTIATTTPFKYPDRTVYYNVTRELITVVVDSPTTWYIASEKCKKAGGTLVTALLYSEEGRAFIMSIDPGFGRLWIGVHQQDRKWVAKNTKREVDFSMLPPWKDRPVEPNEPGQPELCLLVVRTEKGPRLDAEQCDTSVSFMCSERRRPCKPLVNRLFLTWNPKECTTSKELATGMVCRAQCPVDRSKTVTLMGPERIICTDSVWIGRTNLTEMPKCRVGRQYITEVVSGMRKLFHYKNTMVVLLVDNCRDNVSKMEHTHMLEYAESFIRVYPLVNGTRHASFLTFDSTPTELLIDETNSCYMIQSFMEEMKKKPPKHKEGIKRNYASALLAAEKLLDAKQTTKFAKIIVFVTSGPDEGTIQRIEIADRLRKNGIIIIAAGVKNYNRNQLEEIASVDHNNNLMLYTFLNTDDIAETAEQFVKTNKQSTNYNHCV